MKKKQILAFLMVGIILLQNTMVAFAAEPLQDTSEQTSIVAETEESDSLEGTAEEAEHIETTETTETEEVTETEGNSESMENSETEEIAETAETAETEESAEAEESIESEESTESEESAEIGESTEIEESAEVSDSIESEEIAETEEAAEMEEYFDVAEEGSETPVCSAVTEGTAFGIERSYPRIIYRDDFKNTEIYYDAVSYTFQPVTEEDYHYYLNLWVPLPESMEFSDALVENTKVKMLTATENIDFGYAPNAVKGGYDIWVKAVEGFSKTLIIEWDGVLAQNIYMEVCDGCYFEAIKESISLPKKIAFNGINTKMVVGQKQEADVLITKNYEEDIVQIAYSTDASDILSVNKITGFIQALKPGTATLTISALDESGRASSAANMNAFVKITVSSMKAPAGIKVSELKDTGAVISWNADPVADNTEVYAVPYEAPMGGKAAEWKNYIELLIASDVITGMENVVCVTAEAGANQVEVNGLKENTEYIFYVRHVVNTAADETLFAGAVSAKTTTKDRIFDAIIMNAVDEDGNIMSAYDTQDGLLRFVVSEGMELPYSVVYHLFDQEGTEEELLQYASPTYKSSNTKVVKVDKNGKLSLDGASGTAYIYVTGKDASGTVRETGILIRVIGKPQKLIAQTTKLALGSSVRLIDLIKTDVAGNADDIDFSMLNFDELQTEIAASGCLKLSGRGTDATVTATSPGMNERLTFRLREEGRIFSQAVATVTVVDMTAPVIKNVEAKDITARALFTLSSSVQELNGEKYYYTAEITDNVTGKELNVITLRDVTDYNGTDVAAYFETGESDAKGVIPYYCNIYGLSVNKSYNLSVTAHYIGTEDSYEKSSKAMKFATKKDLLTSGGALTVSYVSMDELRKDVNHPGTVIDAEEEIVLVNNSPYALFADVNNLSRALETDKIRWTISSGNTKAATIRANVTGYEAVLTTQKTGRFVVTATSQVTKEVLASFAVKVVPYQARPVGGAKSSDIPDLQNELLCYYQGEDSREDDDTEAEELP